MGMLFGGCRNMFRGRGLDMGGSEVTGRYEGRYKRVVMDGDKNQYRRPVAFACV